MMQRRLRSSGVQKEQLQGSHDRQMCGEYSASLGNQGDEKLNDVLPLRRPVGWAKNYL